MLNVFKRELRANLKSVLIWSAVMFSLAVMGFGEYIILMGEGSSVDLGGVVDLMPRVVKVIFGMGEISINTPEGWYVCMYLWCAMVAYIHAALLGAGIISKEESDRTSEFLYTKPIKRTTIINGKILAAIVNTFTVVFMGWVAAISVFGPQVQGTDLFGYINLSMLGMFFSSLVFLFIGLYLSAVFTGRGRAVRYAAVVIMATYFIAVAIDIVGDIDFLNFLSPFKYFDAVRMLDKGIEPMYALLSAGVIAIAGYLTYALYRKRNLHS